MGDPKAGFCGTLGNLVQDPRLNHRLAVEAGVLAEESAALLSGFELVQTYWLYTYIPWFFGFAAIALLAPAAVRATAPEPALDVDPQELDPARAAVV